MEGEKNKKLLNFKGVFLYMSDREILRNPCYINDQIIEFYFRFLQFTYETQDILLVSPSVSFLLANSDFAGIRHTAESLKLDEKSLILFTINNTLNYEDLEEEKGTTHWSLLVYYKKLDVFVHHDSVKGLNNRHAKKLYNTVKNFVGGDDDNDELPLILRRPNKTRKNNNGTICRKKNFNKELNDDGRALYFEFFTPQQTNVYDCGLYVMKIAAVVCEWYMSRKVGDKSLLWNEFVRNDFLRWYVENNMRSDLLEFVDLLVDNECDTS